MKALTFLEYISSYIRVLNALKRSKKVVFYIEESGDWSFLSVLYENFRNEFPEETIVLTSEKVTRYQGQSNYFKIGTGFIRTLLFLNLKNCIVILTLTDLGNLQLKRSLFPVEYIYIFHSLASTKVVYLDGAFDHYDHVFCSTRIQYNELIERKTETNNNRMQLYKVGYEKIFKIEEIARTTNEIKNLILYAPTWNDKKFDLDLIMNLVDNLTNYELILQFHPMTQRIFKKNLNLLEKILADKTNVKISYNINNLVLLTQASCLITDWSGIAFEYAFALKRPVISIDIPQKIRNVKVKQTCLETFERINRDRIGKVIDKNEIDQIEALINSLKQEKQNFEKKIEYLKQETLYNSQDPLWYTFNCAKKIYLEY